MAYGDYNYFLGNQGRSAGGGFNGFGDAIAYSLLPSQQKTQVAQERNMMASNPGYQPTPQYYAPTPAQYSYYAPSYQQQYAPQSYAPQASSYQAPAQAPVQQAAQQTQIQPQAQQRTYSTPAPVGGGSSKGSGRSVQQIANPYLNQASTAGKGGQSF